MEAVGFALNGCSADPRGNSGDGERVSLAR